MRNYKKKRKQNKGTCTGREKNGNPLEKKLWAGDFVKVLRKDEFVFEICYLQTKLSKL